MFHYIPVINFLAQVQALHVDKITQDANKKSESTHAKMGPNMV